MIDWVAEVRRRETELLTQLRAAFAGDPAVQAFIADRPSVEATLRGLDNTCQLTDIIVRERSVELLLLKDDIATRYTLTQPGHPCAGFRTDFTDTRTALRFF